ncbi:MAG: hypothetical protein WB509_12960 [Acetobacteraceae bacterium]|jgi:hypothetical protein
MATPIPDQFIAIARTIARGFTEQAIGHPNGEALTEAARAIWRGIEVLDGMDRCERPSAARSMRSVRRAVSGTGSRSLIDPTWQTYAAAPIFWTDSGKDKPTSGRSKEA